MKRKGYKCALFALSILTCTGLYSIKANAEVMSSFGAKSEEEYEQELNSLLKNASGCETAQSEVRKSITQSINFEKELMQEYLTWLEEEEKLTQERKDAGQVLTEYNGVYYFNGKQRETYYNLDMSGVVSIMRNRGFSEKEFPYWVREDGCKMLGDYIMVAANLNVYARGSVIETSLGPALVCDTGGFASNHPYGVDIAVDW